MTNRRAKDKATTPVVAQDKERTRTLLNPSTRDQLLAMRFSTTTVDLLLGEVLSHVRMDLREQRKRPTLTMQREALSTMRTAIDEAISALGVPCNLIDSQGLGMALRRRLDAASSSSASEHLDQGIESLTALKIIVSTAITAMPTSGQARNRVRTLHIARIGSALGLRPSTSSEGRFRRVACALYAEAGFPYANPDAAIRAYLASQPRVDSR